MITPDELHAFIIGVAETFCPWEARYIPSNQPPTPVKGEEHYYLAGRGIGFIALLTVLLILVKLIKGVVT